MLFSRRWLGEYVELPADTGQVADRLTFAGFNVDSVRRLPPRKAPRAAAPEAPGVSGAAGTPGDSAPAPAPDFSDEVLDVDVTTNRPDCMNHLGLARELAVLFNRPLMPPRTPGIPGTPTSEPAAAGGLEVEVEEPADCPRYLARVVEGVRVGPSPEWLARRLQAIGQRSIDNVVDATNFVLWEMGQPLHAFDLGRLAGARLMVRRARAGERLTTLDGVDRPLDPEILVIADAERPVALAGVMGGRDTEVSAGTTRILIESACFERRLVRRTAKRLGMHTDASHRFERGTDLEGCGRAADRAAALIAELAGGRVLDGAVDRRGAAPVPRRGRLELARLNAFAGAEVAAADVERWLRGLGFGMAPVSALAAVVSPVAPAPPAASVSRAAPESAASSDTPGSDAAPANPGWMAPPAEAPAPAAAWEVSVPSWRWFDFEPRPDGRVYEADLFEEVLRIYGLDRIAAALPPLPGSDGPRTERQRVRERVRRFLAGVGLAEAINFGFEDPKVAAGLPTLRPGLTPLALANPLSERYSVMRQSLLGNLLDSARFNQRRGAGAVRLFEIGTVFFRRRSPGEADGVAEEGGQVTMPDEQEHVAVVCGGTVGLPWDREVTFDFFDLKGIAEALAAVLGVRLSARPAVLPGMLAGHAAELLDASGAAVGLLGRIEAEEGFPLYAGELALAALEGGGAPRPIDMPARVPGISADFTLTHSLTVTWHDLEAVIDALRPVDLAGVALKVRYQGEGVPPGAVNTTITLLYNAGDRSLTQDEVNERQLALAAELTRRFGWNG